MKWFWLTEFRCSLLGKHDISEGVEEDIFKIPKGRIIHVWCKWCNVCLRVEILNDSEYKLIEDNV